MLARHDCLPDRTLPRQDRRDRRRHHRRLQRSPNMRWATRSSANAATSSSGISTSRARRTRSISSTGTRRPTSSTASSSIGCCGSSRVGVPMSLGLRLVLAVADRGVLGGDREHRLRHQSLSRDDDLARLLRRQRHQLGERHSVHGGRLLLSRAVAGLAHRADRDRARAVRRLHDQGQSDAQRPDVRLAARLGAALAAGRDRRARSRAGRGRRTP